MQFFLLVLSQCQYDLTSYQRFKAFLSFLSQIMRHCMPSKKKSGAAFSLPLALSIVYSCLCVFRTVFMFVYPNGKHFCFPAISLF
jgi:hypothetical protein